MKTLIIEDQIILSEETEKDEQLKYYDLKKAVEKLLKNDGK